MEIEAVSAGEKKETKQLDGHLTSQRDQDIQTVIYAWWMLRLLAIEISCCLDQWRLLTARENGCSFFLF